MIRNCFQNIQHKRYIISCRIYDLRYPLHSFLRKNSRSIPSNIGYHITAKISGFPCLCRFWLGILAILSLVWFYFYLPINVPIHMWKEKKKKMRTLNCRLIELPRHAEKCSTIQLSTSTSENLSLRNTANTVHFHILKIRGCFDQNENHQK